MFEEGGASNIEARRGRRIEDRGSTIEEDGGSRIDVRGEGMIQFRGSRLEEGGGPTSRFEDRASKSDKDRCLRIELR